MFRLFIHLFFKTINSPFENFNKKSLEKFISNQNLINYLLSKKKFFYSWRNKLNNKIVNEKNRINKINIIKKKNGLILKVNTTHSFLIFSNNKSIKSSENLNYLFYISKFKIIDIAINEYTPNKYKKLLLCDSNLCKEPKSNNIWDQLNSKSDDLFNNYSSNFQKNIIKPSFRANNLYNRANAINYAEKYALKSNSNYKNFDDNGGDCTNFVSQCINAGNIPLSNFWKPYTFPWIRVNELYSFLTRNKYAIEVSSLSLLDKGDLIQFFSNSKGFFAHSGIITNTLANGEILYSCHSYDKLNFPLSEIYPILYTKLRLLKIIY